MGNHGHWVVRDDDPERVTILHIDVYADAGLDACLGAVGSAAGGAGPGPGVVASNWICLREIDTAVPPLAQRFAGRGLWFEMVFAPQPSWVRYTKWAAGNLRIITAPASVVCNSTVAMRIAAIGTTRPRLARPSGPVPPESCPCGSWQSSAQRAREELVPIDAH